MTDVKRTIKKEKKQYVDEFGKWTAIGLALGAGLGLLINNLPIGIAVVMALGMSVGAQANDKFKSLSNSAASTVV